MAKVVPYRGSYAIQYNDGTFMPCLGWAMGWSKNPELEVWFSSKEIAEDVCTQIVDRTLPPVLPQMKTRKQAPPTDRALQRWRSNMARMERGRRAVVRWSRRTGKSMF